MPIVTPQERPAPVADESSYRAPKKTISVSTGMDLKQTMSGAPAEENRQAKPVVETEQAPKEVTLSPQLTALARREAKFRQQEQAFKSEQSKLEAERAEIAELKAIKAKLATKDYSGLEELGVDYNDYSNYLLKKLNDTDPKDVAINELKVELQNIKTQQQQSVSKQYEATINKYNRDI